MFKSAQIAVVVWMLAVPAAALETVGLALSGGDDDLRESIEDRSLVVDLWRDDVTDPQEIMAAARSDYARLIGLFYDRGFFGPVISIRVDGREAAQISSLQAPDTISQIIYRVETGPQYTFGTLDIAPLPPGVQLPEGFQSGQTASTSLIREVARTSIRSWRDLGHAKVDISGQGITANHDTRAVTVSLDMAPGPQLRFGTLNVVGNEAVSTRRINKIAGLPRGEVFSPADAEVVSENVRRTGTFRSVVLEEAETPNPDGTLDMNLTVIEQKPRRIRFGADFSNTDGIELSANWLHRNLRGGAERLEIGTVVNGIAAVGRDPGLEASARLTRPATPRSDTDFFILANFGLLDERDFSGENFTLGFGWERRWTDRLTGQIGLSGNIARIDDDLGESRYRFASLPLRLTYDNRNNFVAPTNGFYIDGQLEPYLNIEGTEDGARFRGDLRFYEDFFPGDRLVVAGRIQVGALGGSDLTNTPNYLLFYSGGGGTVRGQEFQSLGVDLPGGGRTGGRSFLGWSGELRARVSDAIEVVGFYDWGSIGEGTFRESDNTSHSGAGLGLRYITPIGPLRVDVATPVNGPDTGSSFLLYIGIGQAF